MSHRVPDYITAAIVRRIIRFGQFLSQGFPRFMNDLLTRASAQTFIIFLNRGFREGPPNTEGRSKTVPNGGGEGGRAVGGQRGKLTRELHDGGCGAMALRPSSHKKKRTRTLIYERSRTVITYFFVCSSSRTIYRTCRYTVHAG